MSLFWDDLKNDLKDEEFRAYFMQNWGVHDGPVVHGSQSYHLLTEKDRAYLEMCKNSAKLFAKCVKRQFFSIVLSKEGRIIGTGYNGAPSGYAHCGEGGCPRANTNDPDGSSYTNCISLHSEENALLYSDRTLREGGTLYINALPCWHCTKLIVGSGIKNFVGIDSDSWVDRDRTLDFLQDNGINVRLSDEDLPF